MKKSLAYSILLLLTIISFFFDKEILYFFSTLRSIGLTSVLNYLTYLGETIIISCIIISILLWKRKRKWIVPVWLSLISTVIITYILKYIINRPRPFQEGFSHIITAPSPSFPSAHSSAVFAIIPFLYILYPKGRIIWMTLGLVVLFSRIYLGVHYLSDVLFGTLIGMAIATFFIYSTDKKWFTKLNFLKK